MSEVKIEDNEEERTYAVLQETNEKYMESWLYFLKFEGNEENLDYLCSQLEKVEPILEEDLSLFNIDLGYLVSENTAKEMTRLALNSFQPHRKFDGTLQRINFRLKKTDEPYDQVRKVYDILGAGQIEDYISEEDENSDISEDEAKEESNEEEETVETTTYQKPLRD